MVSKAEGKLNVLVWSNDGEVSPLIDDNGNLPVIFSNSEGTVDVNIVGSDIDVPVSIDAQTQDLNVLSHGYVNGAWQNNPMLFGYSDIHREYVTYTTPSGMTYNMDMAEVPVGEIWVITSIGMMTDDGAIWGMYMSTRSDSNTYYVDQVRTPAANTMLSYTGWLILEPGLRIRGIFVNAASGKKLEMWVHGFKIDIDL